MADQTVTAEMINEKQAELKAMQDEYARQTAPPASTQAALDNIHRYLWLNNKSLAQAQGIPQPPPK
jgi:hypothetical protein